MKTESPREYLQSRREDDPEITQAINHCERPREKEASVEDWKALWEVPQGGDGVKDTKEEWPSPQKLQRNHRKRKEQQFCKQGLRAAARRLSV